MLVVLGCWGVVGLTAPSSWEEVEVESIGSLGSDIKLYY